MKALITLLSFFASTAFGTTLNPVQLLNPAGSSAGQAVVSTGSNTAPIWANVAATNLAAQAANTVLANATGSSASPAAFAMPSCSTSTSALQWTSGTGFTCYTNSASLTGATFMGAIGVSAISATANLNDTSGTNQFGIGFQSASVPQWATWVGSGTRQFLIQRYVSGTAVDNPIAISNSTGAVTMSDGITNSPISGSTGSFTTLAASGLITPSSTVGIKGTATNDNAQAGSIGEYVTASASSVAMTSNTATNITSISLTAGDWDVCGNFEWVPTSGTASTIISGINTTSATIQAAPNRALAQNSSGFPGANTMTPPIQRISISTTTTVYLVANVTYTGAGTGTGFISARRIR